MPSLLHRAVLASLALRITGRDPRTLPLAAYAGGKRFALPDATIRLLYDAAHSANAAFPTEPAAIPIVPTAPVGAGHC